MRNNKNTADPFIPLDEAESFRIQSSFCRIFSNPKRLQILSLLSGGEMSVSQIAARLGSSLANVSQHLALMREKGALRSRKSGQTVYYRVANPLLIECLQLVRRALLEERIIEHRALAGGPAGSGRSSLAASRRKRK